MSQHKSLSILFNSDGFSFSIADINTKHIISFTKYLFEKTIQTPEVLLSEILRIFANDKELQKDFDEILIIHQNQLSSVVPNEFFNMKNLKNYLDYNIKTLPTDYITFDEVTQINAKNIYIPYVNINNYLFQNFGEFEFKHHSTVLLEKILTYHQENQDESFFCYVSEKQIDIIVIEHNNLILYNSFLFNSEEDFIYYILFVAEQLEMNPEKFLLTFLGNINEVDANYQITKKHIHHINFIKTTSDFFSNSDEFSNHSNYILVS